VLLKALAPDSSWAAQAKIVSQEMEKKIQELGSDDGVDVNVRMVEELAKEWKPYCSIKRKKG
jgi:hypothetical protein